MRNILLVLLLVVLCTIPIVAHAIDAEEAEGVCSSAVSGASFRGHGCVVTSYDLINGTTVSGDTARFTYRTRCENTRGSVISNVTATCTIRQSDGQWIYSVDGH